MGVVIIVGIALSIGLFFVIKGELKKQKELDKTERKKLEKAERKMAKKFRVIGSIKD